MNRQFNPLFLCLCICLICSLDSPCYAIGRDTLFAASLHPYGRFIKNTNGDLELISSAVHVGFTFSATICSISAYILNPGAHNYLQYTLDGVYQKRIRISGNMRQPIMIGGMGKGRHTIWIYKATEAATGPIFIEKIMAHDIKALKVSPGPLIEFIGNSITCGAAADPSEIPCGMGEYHDQHNAYNAYGPRVARALGANFILSSVSGIGIYRNWNTLAPAMPQVYEKTDFQVNSLRNWNFKTYTPRLVSIALGTNDFSDGDGRTSRLPFDSSVFVSNYIRFVKMVKSKYPKTRIILLSSPMLNGSKREKLQNCLMAVKTNTDKSYPADKHVVLFFFRPMQARGCGGHPSVEDHAILAAELIPVFKKLM
jgi:GDSL-like Lipase/Acylhydrolase family/Carbohydrate esterase 2 N-terminal